MNLTVVIPTLNRAAILERTLDRLDRQDTRDFEVLIGADAAEPDVDGLRGLARGRPYPIAVVQADAPGVSAARNRALREAREPVVLFLGDDMLPAPDLVSRHLAGHARYPEPESGVQGHVRWADEIPVTVFMRWLDQGMQFDFGSIKGANAGWWHFYACNASVKTELLARVGGYDEAFRFGYEEMDLALRLHEHGFRLHYDRKARVEHLHPPTVEAWQRRMRTIARAERQFIAKHPHMEPYFLPLFERAEALPPAGGGGLRLAARVSRRVPVVGPRAWNSTQAYFLQQLAPAFLEEWRKS